MTHISTTRLVVRCAGPQDVRRIWEWRHAGDAARFYRSGTKTHFENHAHWYKHALLASDRIMLIVECDAIPIGHVRFDLAEGDRSCANVGICLSPLSRGQGLSGPILNAALIFGARSGIATFLAEVHEKNLTSLRLFEALDFKPQSQEKHFVSYILSPSLGKNKLLVAETK